MSNVTISMGSIFAPYNPFKDQVVPWGKNTTLEDLLEACLFIDGRQEPRDPEKLERTIKNHEGFKPFIEQQMMRDLVYQIKIWEHKIYELQLEKTDIHPSHKDWPLLKKAISEARAAYTSEHETYLAMLKLNSIDYDYFKFALRY